MIILPKQGSIFNFTCNPYQYFYQLKHTNIKMSLLQEE
ncbi:hypothetical protein BVRB_7g173300 [Beta vulgaris subsp. vulgaris]|nr:hypothetical protein BVRB_7g173300 [Beta vulgaris subsp. vulgaris]